MTTPGVEPPRSEPPPQHQIKPSRLGGLWVTMTCGAVVLLLLLIFILENGHAVDIAFFGVHGSVPLGVALLLAAVLGVLLVVVPGGGRMLQLRMAARRHRRTDDEALTRARGPRVVPDDHADGSRDR